MEKVLSWYKNILIAIFRFVLMPFLAVYLVIKNAININEKDQIKGIEISYTIGLALISLFLSVAGFYLKEVQSHTAANIWDYQEFEKIVFNAMLFFIAGELLPIFYASIRIEPLFRDNTKAIRNLHHKNEVQNNITQTVLKAFQYQDHKAHEAASFALADYFKTIVVKRDKISVVGDYLSRSLYENFWEQIVRAQELNKARGADTITAYVTHSASVNMWKSVHFSLLKHTQERFCKDFGGKIIRVLIQESSNTEEGNDDYHEAMKDMAERGTEVFYLKRAGAPKNYDFIIVAIGEELFALEWSPEWGPGSSGTVSACVAVIDNRIILKDYWWKWCDVLDELKSSQVSSINGAPLLSLRPSANEYDVWKKPPLS